MEALTPLEEGLVRALAEAWAMVTLEAPEAAMLTRAGLFEALLWVGRMRAWQEAQEAPEAWTQAEGVRQRLDELDEFEALRSYLQGG